jgi:hypothetical protein
LLFETPRLSASRPKTRQAAGKANFWWRYITSLCGETFMPAFSGDLRLELRDGHLGRAVHDLGLREDVVGVRA